MNDDLISRQEVLNKLNKLDQQELYLPCHFKEFVIDEVPSVEPRTGQVKRTGKWFGTVCSACGESTSFYYDCDYCPQCGARMEVEET